MKINQQLFEDVLSGKLKGMFVLRDGTKIPSCKLESNSKILYFLAGDIVYCDGRYSRYTETFLDIVDFIPDTDMKENELTIEIPEGKTVDWEASQKQNKIIFKEDEKPLTYDDVCKKLFSDGGYFTNAAGGICHSHNLKGLEYQFNNATTEHQLECILAKNKLANVAKYLNDGWEPSESDFGYFICRCNETFEIISRNDYKFNNNVIFNSRELAEKAIKILGEETIKLALEPLGI